MSKSKSNSLAPPRTQELYEAYLFIEKWRDTLSVYAYKNIGLTPWQRIRIIKEVNQLSDWLEQNRIKVKYIIKPYATSKKPIHQPTLETYIVKQPDVR